MILSTIRKFAINYHVGLLMAGCFLLFSCEKDRVVAKGQQSQAVQEDQAEISTRGGYTNEDIFRGVMFMSGSAANAIPEIREQNLLIKNLNPGMEGQAEVQNMQNAFMAQIELKNPGYIKAFATTLKSHDPELIKDELVRAEDIIFTAVSNYFKFDLTAARSAKEEVLHIFVSKQAEVEELLTQFQLGQITKAEFESGITSTLQLDHSRIKALAESVDETQTALFGGCVAFLSFLACNVAVAINIAGYINVALAAAVAVAVAAWLAVYKWTWNNPKHQSFNKMDYERYIDNLATRF